MINPWSLLPKWGKFTTIGLVLLGSILMILSKINTVHENGVSLGVNQERAITATTTLERVELSREVTEEIRKEAATGNGSLLYAQCLRSARTPANCQRFLPEQSKAHD